MAHTDEWTAIRDDAAETLSRYVQFDTTNPPGNEMEAAQWVAGQLRGRKITDDITIHEPAPGRGLVIGRIEGNEALKPLVLSHHMDVVPADPARWSHRPFAGEVGDGYVWGRGAIDDKNMGVIYLLALERLIRQGVAFRRPVVFLAVPDEECGSAHGTGWLVEHHLDELDPEWVWDEGGGGFTGLMGDAPVFGVAVAEKQVRQLRLTATGEPGHASMPHKNNANITLIDAIGRILKPRPMRVNEVTTAMFRELAKTQRFPASFMMRHLSNSLILKLAGPQLAASREISAMLRDTISLTMLQSGSAVNVIPERAEASIDCRLLPDTDADRFRHWLEMTIDDKRVRVETIETSDPTMISPIDSPFLDAVRNALGRHVPDAVAFPLQTPGATDSRHYRARSIPSYGFGPFVIDTKELACMHGIDERFSIENLELGIKIACDVIEELCAT
ncbi:MAG: M20/M25/M40 family metallo-hydrolase [Anaerolineae bacterium]|jgi:acetylornithine deacetylase/succinyl-diaminopimelate desuccinylase-like protein